MGRLGLDPLVPQSLTHQVVEYSIDLTKGSYTLLKPTIYPGSNDLVRQPDTALLLALAYLFIVVCCLLLSASAIAIDIANATSTTASAINATSSASTASASLAALTFRLGGASRRRGQRMSWSSPVWERGLKRSISFHILLNSLTPMGA